MRHPKTPQPSPTATPSPLSTEPQYDDAMSIRMIEQVLTGALDPDHTITPDQLCDMMEMMITDLHLRKVTGAFWCEVQTMCVNGVKLATSISSESGLKSLPGLPPETLKILDGSIELSLKEIRQLRGKLMAKLELLKQCAPQGTKIH